MKKAFLNWSSGKDAAYALYLIQKQKEFKIEKLFTTVNLQVDRVSMHGLRKELLEKQVRAIGIPLHVAALDGNVSLETYNDRMQEEMRMMKMEGFTHSVFGDIFLEDLKEYREQQLQKVDLKPVFPLWNLNTTKLMQNFIDSGFKAITVSVNAKLLDRSFCGRIIDEQFLKDLPAGVDPAGENGEFHTFVYDGPIFSKPVSFQKGEIVERSFQPAGNKGKDCYKKEEISWDTRFFYCDLLPYL